MKILNTVRWSLEHLGYSATNRNILNKKQVEITISGILCFPLIFIYLQYEAVTAQDYLYSIFVSSVGVFIFISFVDTSQKVEKIFLLIDLHEKIFNERTLLSYLEEEENIFGGGNFGNGKS